MQVSLKNSVVGLVLAMWAIAACDFASAQVLPRRRPIEPVPVVTPAQPVVEQAMPAQPGVATPAATAPAVTTQTQQTAQTQVRAGRLLHGRSLIGLNIWGANQQWLGRVQDFIVDTEGECPKIFFAVAPPISSLQNEYVIVPFSALRTGFDERQRTDYFTLNMSLDNLGRAPHVAINQWTTAPDRQFISTAGQFYQRIEHTAARPQTGGQLDRATLQGDTSRRGELLPGQNNTPQDNSGRMPPADAGKGMEKSGEKPLEKPAEKGIEAPVTPIPSTPLPDTKRDENKDKSGAAQPDTKSGQADTDRGNSTDAKRDRSDERSRSDSKGDSSNSRNEKSDRDRNK